MSFEWLCARFMWIVVKLLYHILTIVNSGVQGELVERMVLEFLVDVKNYSDNGGDK